MDQTTEYKQQAAEVAVAAVRSGMVVGLGHGSTAIFALRLLSRLLHDGVLRDIHGVPCSTHVEAEAQALGIPLTTLDANPVIDVTIDGADEVAPSLDVIKGGGGAFLREKIVAENTRREIIVVDERKLSRALGEHAPVPVEVVAFGLRAHIAYLEGLGARVTQRSQADGTPYLTDGGNYILDAHFGPIALPTHLAARLQQRAGLVAHGLFLGLAHEVIVAGPSGLRHLHRRAHQYQ